MNERRERRKGERNEEIKKVGMEGWKEERKRALKVTKKNKEEE